MSFAPSTDFDQPGRLVDILADHCLPLVQMPYDMLWLNHKASHHTYGFLYLSASDPGRGGGEGKQGLIHMICLYVLRFNVPVNNFSIMSGWSHRSLGITSTFGE